MDAYDVYLFDMDGTVTKTFEPWLEIVRDTLLSYKIPADTKTIIRKVFGNARNGLLELGVPEHDLPKIFSEWEKRAADSMRHTELYPGIKEVLQTLKAKGKKTALITATIRPTVNLILETHGLQDLFDITVTGDEVTAHKPNPEGILYALTHLGVKREKAVMLGDSEKDIRAAHNADVDSVLFFPPEHVNYHHFDQLQADNPTYVIKSWPELVK